MILVDVIILMQGSIEKETCDVGSLSKNLGCFY